MDVMNGTDSSNLVAAIGIDDKTTEESPDMTCDENSGNLNSEDTVEEIADESTIIEDKSTTEAEPQVAEKIEVAVVTCANEETDADSSLEIFFDVNQEAVDDSTKVELQIEVDKTTNGISNEDKEDSAIEEVAETEKTTEEDKENLPEEKEKEEAEEVEEVENNVLTNGNASPTGDIIENGESAVKSANETAVSLISDDIVILSDDESECTTTNKQENNEEKKEESENKNVEENVEKISAVAEILEDSNNSDSSNLLEISTVQEEREKERLQEKSGEEDEEYEEEDADADAEVEVEDEETVTENDIEVVESNLDNEMLGPPPAKRSKLSEEKKDAEEEEQDQEQEQEEIALPKTTVESEIITNQQDTENKTELNETSSEKTEKAATPTETSTATEDIEMEVEPETKLADSNELKINGIELSCITKTNTAKCDESVALQFLRKFKKNFDSMNRTELEEFVTQKIIETIVYQSQFSELNKLLKIQEQITERHRNHITELSKQLRDLNMVHNRVLKDLEEHYSQIVLPVKITRAVGLQVCIPKRGEAASIIAAKNEQKQQQQQLKQTAINNEEEKTFTNNNNNNSAERMLNTRKLNKNQTPTVTPFAQTYTQFDANKPSTSNAAKEAAAAAAASLQIRKINITTPLVEDTDTGKIMHNTNKKQNSSTKEVLPTTSIPATVYNMQNYMSSLNQLSSGAITITPAKPKEKECIDLTEDDDCIVMPATTKDTPALSSHILNTSQVYRQRVNIQSTIVNPTLQVKNPMRTHRPPYGAAANTNTNAAVITGAATTTAVNLNATNNLNANSVVRKSQPNNMTSYVSPARNASANLTAPPLVMIPTNTQSATQTALKRKLPKQTHPAPLPYMPPPILKPEWKRPPPRPSIRINTADKGGIVISWTMDESEEIFAECVSYQIYAYQQTSAQPQTEFWRYVGDVKAMLLPMAVTLTQFQEGQRYFFAVRAVDVHKRFGPFSAPKTWT